MTVVPVGRDADGAVAHLVSQVRDGGRLTLVNSAGEPVAVVMSPRELEGLEESVAILDDPEAMSALEEAQDDFMAGQEHTSDEVLAQLRRRVV